MKQTVRHNKHDFRPNSLTQLLPIRGDFSLRLLLDLTDPCWYDTKTFAGGERWNKAGGIGNFLSANNENAVLLAWRPAKDGGYFEAAIYINDSEGNWDIVGAPLQFHVSMTVVAIFVRKGDVLQVQLSLAKADPNLKAQYARKDKACLVSILKNPTRTYEGKVSGWQRIRGAWFGGPVGSPHAMELWTSWAKYLLK